MREYKRLTVRREDGKAMYACSLRWEAEDEQTILDRLAELEDMLESGLLQKLPCKVGDKVWVLDDPDYVADIFEMEVEDIEITRSKIIVSGVHNGEYQDFVSSFVFKTKAQAEARLKELKGGK